MKRMKHQVPLRVGWVMLVALPLFLRPATTSAQQANHKDLDHQERTHQKVSPPLKNQSKVKNEELESPNNPVALLWRSRANNPELTYREIVTYCDSLFAIPENKDDDEDGEYNGYLHWKAFWGPRLDARTGKLHDFNKAAYEKILAHSGNAERSIANPNNIGSSSPSTNATGGTGGGGKEDNGGGTPIADDCNGDSKLQQSIQNYSYGGTDGYGWSYIGPQNMKSGNIHTQNLGRVTAISVNPVNHDEVYAASEWGGLWKTKNGGHTWTCLTDNNHSISGIGVGSFDVDYSVTPHRIFFSVGYPANYQFPWFSYLFTGGRAYGIYYSLDDGSTYNYVDGLTVSPLNINWSDDAVGDVRINPGNPNFVFFTTKYKVARINVSTLTSTSNYPASIDALIDYSSYLPAPNTTARSSCFGKIEFLPANPNEMFVTSNAIFGNIYLRSAQLFHITNCMGVYGVNEVTNNLAGGLLTNSYNFSSGTTDWNFDNWAYSGSDMQYTDAASTGLGCLETNVDGNYTDPAYNYSIAFNVTIPAHTRLDVVLRDPNPSALYSTDCGNPPTNDVSVFSYDNTASSTPYTVYSTTPWSGTITTSSSTSSTDNYVTRLIFKASSTGSYNSAIDGAMIIDNVSITQKYFDFIGITTSPAAPNTIFANASRLASGSDVLQSSTSLGSSWTPLGGPVTGIFKVSDINPNMIYYGHSGGANFFSYDVSTTTNTYLGSGLGHVDVRAIAVSQSPSSPGTEDLLVGEDGGLSAMISGSWVDMTSGTFPGVAGGIFNSSLAYGIGSSIHTGEVVLATQDNSTLRGKQVDWTYWQHEQGGDNYAAEFGKRSLTKSTYYYSVNGGGGPYDVDCGNCTGGFSGLYPASPQPYRKLKTTFNAEYFAANDNIYRVNSGNTGWNSITTGATGWPGAAHPDRDIWGYAPDLYDSKYIAAYLNRDGSFWTSAGDFAITTTGGSSWTTHPNTTGRNFLDMAADPRSNGGTKRLWAGAGWYDAPGVGRVYQSIDNGTTWKDFSTGLPDGPINALVYDEQSRYLFAGTDNGVYARHVTDNPREGDGPDIWQCFSLNLPNAFVTGLEINRCTGKLYVSTYGRGAYQTELPPDWNWDDPSDPFSTDDITSNQTWSTDRDQLKSIIVEPGVTLTIQNCIVNMARDKNITVKTGGVLIVDHATITNTCGILWGCISVQGDPTQTQNLSNLALNLCNQGYVKLDHATLENAYIGLVIAGQYYDGSDQADYTSGFDGGLVIATNSTFHNLVHGVWVGNYSHTQNSSFTNCTFLHDAFLQSHHYTNYDAGYARRFGTKFDVIFGAFGGQSDGVTFDGCTFKTDLTSNPDFHPDPDLRGVAISAANASFLVRNCTFQNLTRGVDTWNDPTVTNYPFVTNSIFTNNFRAATFKGNNNAVFKDNTVAVGPPCSYPSTSSPFDLEPYGAYFSQNQGCFIYNNTISMFGSSSWPTHKSYGIIINNTNNPTTVGAGMITLNKNTISTDIGICAYQDNRGTQISCNNLTGCSQRGIAVWGPNSSNPGLISDQGSCVAPAGNTFYQPASCSGIPFDIASGYMDPAYDFHYYEYAGATYLAPCISSSTYPFVAVNTPTLCSTVCSGCCPSLSEPTYTVVQHKQIANNYKQDFDNANTAIRTLQGGIDNGNSVNLSVRIATGQINIEELVSGYLSDEILLALIAKSSLSYQDMKAVILKNSGLNKIVWDKLVENYSSLSRDPAVIKAQIQVSGRVDILTKLSDQFYARNSAVNELKKQLIVEGRSEEAAQLYASIGDYESAAAVCMQANDMSCAQTMAQSIKDRDMNKLMTLWIDHKINGFKGNLHGIRDSLSTNEKQAISNIAVNPYTHAGELARLWLCRATDKAFFEVMPALKDGTGNNTPVDDHGTSVGSLVGFDDITLYPNPANLSATVMLTSGNWGIGTELNAYDVMGRRLLQVQLDKATDRYEINTVTWIPGTYTIIISRMDGTKTIQKLTIAK